MKTLRRWQLDSTRPICLTLAADARLSQTDYHDDQVWELSLGSGESPGLQLQTRYGGRAGLAALVPMWNHDGRAIYQAQAYAHPPYVTGLAPGYLRVQATLTPQLALLAEYWAIDSHTVGIQFTLANAHVQPTKVQLDLIAFIGSSGKEQKLHLIGLETGKPALGLGKIGNLMPTIVLEGATADGSSPKLSRAFTIPGRKKITLRLVHAGLTSEALSLQRAHEALKLDWANGLKQMEAAAQAIPSIETGDEDLDATIAFAYRELAHSYMKPTASLPYPSVTLTRGSAHGYHNAADKAWSGQSASWAYLEGLAMAAVDPALAQGLIRNYLAVQQPDGWIDAKPGLSGQKQGDLCMPILARLAWGIFQYSDDAAFVKDVFPGLLKFFERWLKPDLDRDGDGVPEWQSEAQTGSVFTPTFATWQAWGGGANIRLVESPDLLAYLISEARSLKEMAYFLRDTAQEQRIESIYQRLVSSLESLWDAQSQRYRYRDRDSHQTTASVTVVSDARAGEPLLLAEKLSPPNRLIVRVSGGVNLLPRMTLTLDGLDAAGQSLHETVAGDAFVWAGGRGVYTSEHLYAQIDRVQFEGLSRVYRVDIQTMDTTRLDINHLLPLWSTGLTAARAETLIGLLNHPDHFWRSSGVSVNSAQDSHFDPANAEGSGGVWPFWLTLMGEALIEAGHMKQAADLLKRLLRVQTEVLKADKHFSEFYHADQPKGLGEPGHAAGIVPLHLMLRVWGVRIISPRRVWTGSAFDWDQPVTISRHGVTVQRSQQHTKIQFPSGHQTQIVNGDWQEVIDAGS